MALWCKNAHVLKAVNLKSKTGLDSHLQSNINNKNHSPSVTHTLTEATVLLGHSIANHISKHPAA